jgi:inorganic triphosphatase YgiF
VRGGLVARDEFEVPLRGNVSDPRRVAQTALLNAISEPVLRRAIRRATGTRRLGPRVETRFQRSTLRLRHGNSQIELALDRGEVRAGRARLPICELELERLAGPTRALFDLALDLATDFVLQPSAIGKAERGFQRLRGEAPSPSRARPVALPQGASLELTLRAVLGEGLRQLSANRSAAELDPEGVHQLRIAARRLRSTLRLFKDWLPPRAAKALSAELRWFGRELGRARDLDVFVGGLLDPLRRSRPDDAGLAALHEAASAARAEANSAVRSLLASRRHALLVLRLGRFVEGPLGRRQGRPIAALRAARPLLRRRTTKLRALGERIDQLSARELHGLRIQTRRLRQALELIGPLFGDKRSARVLRRLAALQDRLGALNDLANAERLLGQLHEHPAAAASPAVTLAEGFVLGYAAAAVAVGRAALPAAWRRVAKIEALWESRR